MCVGTDLARARPGMDAEKEGGEEERKENETRRVRRGGR